MYLLLLFDLLSAYLFTYYLQGLLMGLWMDGLLVLGMGMGMGLGLG